MSTLLGNLFDSSGNSAKTACQCKKCFMTGKACIYEKIITERLEKIKASGIAGGDNYKDRKAFMLMPFGSTLDAIYNAQLEPCLRSVVGDVRRADDVTRTGYVVCERICRQIQESQLACAEISTDNPNVYYELGLAYALERPIALFAQKANIEKRQPLLNKLGITTAHLNEYVPFDMLASNTVKLWNHEPPEQESSSNSHTSVVILLADHTDFKEKVGDLVFTYTTDSLCRGTIHRAIERMYQEKKIEWGQGRRKTITIHKELYSDNLTFHNVRSAIRNASCVIICTHSDEPSSYFWMGYAHGLEKDVVPVTVQHPPDEDHEVIDKNGQTQEFPFSVQQAALPFDVRALWHMVFLITGRTNWRIS